VNRTSLANSVALLAALVGTTALGWPHANRRPRTVRAGTPTVEGAPARVPLGDGAFAIPDATGHLVPLRHYRRIVSTNLVTDRLLVELCEPTRILAISTAAAERKRDGFRYQGMTAVDGFGPAEAMVALQPDLVLTNSFGSPGHSERLRSAGIEVFDLGELHGEKSLAYVALGLGELLEAPGRARLLMRGFANRMRGVSAGLGPRKPIRAMYLSTLGPDLQGGTRGTSYHDILLAAGLIDVAAEIYRDWPVYAAEQVLALAPEIIVTREGFAEGICKYPGMDHAPPCRGQGRIVELPGELLDEPGLAMLEAAEMLFSLVYGGAP
jgi:iron complex transport system substrate-binding protein